MSIESELKKLTAAIIDFNNSIKSPIPPVVTNTVTANEVDEEPKKRRKKASEPVVEEDEDLEDLEDDEDDEDLEEKPKKRRKKASEPVVEEDGDPEDDEDNDDEEITVESVKKLAKIKINDEGIDRAVIKKIVKDSGAEHILGLDQSGLKKARDKISKL